MSESREYWNAVHDNVVRQIHGDPLEACRRAREAFHDIARCGDVERSQAVAETWMRILAQFVEVKDGEDKK